MSAVVEVSCFLDLLKYLLVATQNPRMTIRAVMQCAESFLNWRIYWLAIAWLVEETVRYGILFWYAQHSS